MECVVCVPSLVEEGFIHQTVGTKETEEELDLRLLHRWTVTAGSEVCHEQFLGFGGHNAVLLLKKYQ